MLRRRSETINHCEECGEKLPQRSRVCPYCLYIKFFDDDCRCHITPVPYLNIMRSYVDEMLALPMPKIFAYGGYDTIIEEELVESFGVVETIVDNTFGEDSDVVLAVMQMSDIMDEEIAKRHRAVLISRLILLALFVLITSVISLLVIF